MFRGLFLDEADRLRQDTPELYVRLAKQSMKKHVEAMLAFQQKGSIVFDYGNNIRQVAKDEGLENAFDFPGFVPAYIRLYSVKEKGRSVGRRFPEIRQIFTVRMRY